MSLTAINVSNLYQRSMSAASDSGQCQQPLTEVNVSDSNQCQQPLTEVNVSDIGQCLQPLTEVNVS